MKILKYVLNFYIDSSIHVSLAVCALLIVSFLRFAIPIDIDLLFFVFFASITAYNFVKYAGIAKLHHRSLTSQLKVIQVFSLVCFLVLLSLTFLQSRLTLLICSVLAVFTFLYAVPFLPNKKNLRNLKSLKIFIIAFVWAAVAAFLPWQNLESLLQVEVFWLFTQYFFFVVSITLPFELRDLYYDKLALGTIPQKIGVPKTKRLGVFFLMLVLLIQFLFFKENWQIDISLHVICLVASLFLIFSSVKQKKYFASFWVEALPIFWAILLYSLL